MILVCAGIVHASAGIVVSATPCNLTILSCTPNVSLADALERPSASRNHKEREAGTTVPALPLPTAIALTSYKMSLWCAGVVVLVGRLVHPS